jgi:glucosamine kinase
MTQPIFIGVDGGATKCTVRVEDGAGQLLGRETSGPANIRLSPYDAWQSIYAALKKILPPLGIEFANKSYQFHAGMGLAGCEIREAYQTFLGQATLFDTLIVSSDAHAACLGAHGGNDGAIIIVGTGSVGYQIDSNQVTKIGGFGFPHDDEGGGAWIGLQAVRITLQSLDKRLPTSNLSNAIYAYFNKDQTQLVNWANQANSTQFALLAPIVIQQYQAGDLVALQIMQQAAFAIDAIGEALEKGQLEQKKLLPCSLVGGISPFVQPFLSAKLRERIYPSLLPPDAGAVLLVRRLQHGTSRVEVHHG